MKRCGAIFLSAVLLLLSLSGCAAPARPPERETPAAFTWDPHTDSAYLEEYMGQERLERYHSWVDALLAGEERVPCDDWEDLDVLTGTLRATFPPFTALVEDYSMDEEGVVLTYTGTPEEREALLTAFAGRMETLVEASVREGDTPLMAALALYHDFAASVVYDEAGMEDNYEGDLSTYQGIMEGTGICQTFAPAWAYLAMAVGLDCIGVGGLDDVEENAHDWAAFRLDGEDFFADPTFENGEGGQGLRYFGMTADQRAASGYPLENVSVGWNMADGGDLHHLTDPRFAPLWEAAQVQEIRRPGENMELDCLDDRGDQFTLVITPDNQVDLKQ